MLTFNRRYARMQFLERNRLSNPHIEFEHMVDLVLSHHWFWKWLEKCRMSRTIMMAQLTPACDDRSHGINTLRPRQDGRHFPNDIFKCIFFNQNV